MPYDFSIYQRYMADQNLDAIIVSNHKLASRILDWYHGEHFWMALGSREYSPLVGCDAKGELICANSYGSGVLFEQRISELTALLHARGLSRATLGLEMSDLPAQGLLLLQENLPHATLVDATRFLRQDMARKTEREIGFVAKAVAASEAGFREVMAHLRESVGRPESELMWRHYAPEVNRHGAELLGSSLTGRAWEWCEDISEPVVKEGGEPINFDLLCGYQGLISDIAFRGIVGEPDSAFVETFDVSLLVVEALKATVRAGMTATEAEAACLEAIHKAVGNWPLYWAVHSVGFCVHEFPQIGSSYPGQEGEYVFEEGNVLSVEAIAEEQYVLRAEGLHRIGEMPMQIHRAHTR